MSERVNQSTVGVWLLFCQRPTDRALEGWNALADFGVVACDLDSEQFFVEWVSGELTL